MNLFDAFPHVLLQLIHSSHSEAWQLTETEQIEILNGNWDPTLRKSEEGVLLYEVVS